MLQDHPMNLYHQYEREFEDKVFLERSHISIHRLRELAEADLDGRCIVLPVKTVFEPTWDAGPDCDGNCPHCFEPERCDICAKGKLFIYERSCTQEHISRLGKTVFKTRKEAESACEQLEKELKRLHEN